MMMVSESFCRRCKSYLMNGIVKLDEKVILTNMQNKSTGLIKGHPKLAKKGWK
jgi:hypothetical protein